jgi:F-type H+-transporting ATPase subunit b
MATTDHAHAAGTEVPGGVHEKGVFPPFDSTTFAPQLIWLVLIFGALYLLMSRLALPRIENILETRRERIADDLDSAADMQQKAKDAGVAYETTLANARASAQTTAQQMRDNLAADAAAKRKTLEEELNTKLATAERSIAATKTQAMSSVGDIATTAAADIVAHLTGKPADAKAIAAAIAAAAKG